MSPLFPRIQANKHNCPDSSDDTKNLLIPVGHDHACFLFNLSKKPNSKLPLENATLPLGSILVKEGYSDSEGQSLNKVTIMKKINGYDPNHNNWFWANYNSSGELAGNNGAESMCYNCHASGKDYILFKDW